MKMYDINTEMYTEILARYLSKENAHVIFPDLQLNAKEIVEMQCYKALQKIKAIIDDDSLEDDSCFARIEEIICILEEIGSDGGIRHDFG